MFLVRSQGELKKKHLRTMYVRANRGFTVRREMPLKDKPGHVEKVRIVLVPGFCLGI
jgi:hypothetical protein